MNKNNFIIEKYRCPVCGEENQFMSLELEGEPFGEYAGRYCMKCIAKWIYENFPKQKKIKDKEEYK